MRLVGRWISTGEPLAVTLADGRVARVEGAESVGDQWLSPGFCDLQVNGAGGVDFTSANLTDDAIAAVVATLRRHGTTRFLPTIITSSRETVLAALRQLESACASDPRTAVAIAGYHLEGPYISADDGPRGAHPRAFVRQPDWDEFRRWFDAANGRIRLLTLAPEAPGALPFVERAIALGVRVALGHTMATGEQIAAAVAAGATLSTHLGNGIAATLPRHPNPLWEQLADDRLAASVIADGHHLPASVLRVIARIKGERTVLVSDASPLAGLPVGTYELWGQAVDVRDDGSVRLAGTPLLAGAGVFLDQAIAGMVAADVALREAVFMATVAPRRVIGEPIPTLTVGALADVVSFTWRDGVLSFA